MVLFGTYAAYILSNVCVLSIVSYCALFGFMFYGLMPETNAYSFHSFIHSL